MNYYFIETIYGKIPANEIEIRGIPNKEYFDIMIPEIDSISRQNIFLPKKMTPQLAYFAGYFFGDGGLKDIEKSYLATKRHEYKIKIGDEFFLQVKLIQIIFSELFGMMPPIRVAKGEKLFYLDPTNKSIYLFLVNVFELPCGPKANKIKIPKIIKDADSDIKKWFIRGLFDADGDTRAVEAGFNSQPRIKLRMKAKEFVFAVKKLIEENFNVSVNGPYIDKSTDSAYIQVERYKDIISLYNQNLFFHPIKHWRLRKTCSILSKKLKLAIA